MTDTTAKQVADAISFVLAIRQNPAQNAVRATIARGVHPERAAAAYEALAAAGKLTGITSPSIRDGAVRAAAIVAANPRIRLAQGPLARAFRAIDSKDVGKQLTIAAQSNGKVAARLLASLVARAGQSGRGVNFYALGSTLAFWETGTQTRRRAHRDALIYDFYDNSTSDKKASA